MSINAIMAATSGLPSSPAGGPTSTMVEFKHRRNGSRDSTCSEEYNVDTPASRCAESSSAAMNLIAGLSADIASPQLPGLRRVRLIAAPPEDGKNPFGAANPLSQFGVATHAASPSGPGVVPPKDSSSWFAKKIAARKATLRTCATKHKPCCCQALYVLMALLLCFFPLAVIGMKAIACSPLSTTYYNMMVTETGSCIEGNIPPNAGMNVSVSINFSKPLTDGATLMVIGRYGSAGQDFVAALASSADEHIIKHQGQTLRFNNLELPIGRMILTSCILREQHIGKFKQGHHMPSPPWDYLCEHISTNCLVTCGALREPLSNCTADGRSMLPELLPQPSSQQYCVDTGEWFLILLQVCLIQGWLSAVPSFLPGVMRNNRPHLRSLTDRRPDADSPTVPTAGGESPLADDAGPADVAGPAALEESVTPAGTPRTLTSSGAQTVVGEQVVVDIEELELVSLYTRQQMMVTTVSPLGGEPPEVALRQIFSLLASMAVTAPGVSFRLLIRDQSGYGLYLDMFDRLFRSDLLTLENVKLLCDNMHLLRAFEWPQNDNSRATWATLYGKLLGTEALSLLLKLVNACNFPPAPPKGKRNTYHGTRFDCKYKLWTGQSIDVCYESCNANSKMKRWALKAAESYADSDCDNYLYPLIAVQDARHAPIPQYFNRMLAGFFTTNGQFRTNVAFVQTVQWFTFLFEHDSYDSCDRQMGYFLRFCCVIRDRGSVATSSGTNGIWFAPRGFHFSSKTLIEDSETSLKVFSEGKISVYIHDQLAHSVAKPVFPGYVQALFRWTYGAVELTMLFGKKYLLAKVLILLTSAFVFSFGSWWSKLAVGGALTAIAIVLFLILLIGSGHKPDEEHEYCKSTAFVVCREMIVAASTGYWFDSVPVVFWLLFGPIFLGASSLQMDATYFAISGVMSAVPIFVMHEIIKRTEEKKLRGSSTELQKEGGSRESYLLRSTALWATMAPLTLFAVIKYVIDRIRRREAPWTIDESVVKRCLFASKAMYWLITIALCWFVFQIIQAVHMRDSGRIVKFTFTIATLSLNVLSMRKMVNAVWRKTEGVPDGGFGVRFGMMMLPCVGVAYMISQNALHL
eukprot:TRINITY_DN7162_c0_g2_i1.p1 TRINITY_DN7162_c0_g2~~TRINITY_DN7162_c0_g2_i1.p1  ORF type:complete len:1088 (-),score=179.28 TRINITY_DN7162_c0_g2_i1:97-3360(-)